MAGFVLNYGIQPSEFWHLTRAQKQALNTTAADIAQRMKG